MSDWDAAVWTAVIAGGALALTLVGLGYTHLQLRQARSELNDKRLDDKVYGVIGQNILLINGLSDKARQTLEEAKTSADDIRKLQAEAEQGLAELREQLTHDHKRLESSMGEARTLMARIDDAAKRADKDAEQVSQVTEAFNTSIATALNMDIEKVRANFAPAILEQIREYNEQIRKYNKESMDTIRRATGIPQKPKEDS